jgi:hypothetical protein
MKNIHVLPTDKPSRLHLGDNGNFVFGMVRTSIESRNNAFTNKHIYITSDEEISISDYITDGYRVWKWKDDSSLLGSKKIILTTDQDLIKDGVQAIDDEFLEWFVKNPSCEEVEIINTFDYIKKGYVSHSGYKIQITKEEPKQETLEEVAEIICHTHKTPIEQANEIIKLVQDKNKYSEEDLKEAFAMGRTNATIKDFNTKFKNK